MIGQLGSYPILCAITALLCFIQGCFVLVKNPNNLLNRLYFLFCVCINFWLIPMALLTSKHFDFAANMILAKLVYTGVVFMPTLALHISRCFLEKNVPKNTDLHIRIAYALTIIFLVLLWLNGHFISGIYEYSWGYYPKGDSIHKVHMAFLILTASFGIYLLYKGMLRVKRLHGKSQEYFQNKYMFLSLLFVLCGAIDFLPNLGIDIYPPGFFFVLFFVYAITYALFKHNLMGVSVVIKKSLVYSVLITLIATIYFIGLYLASTLLKDWAKIQSLPMTVILLTLVTLISRPLERKIANHVDKLFFKKPLHEMELENQMLHSEVQKQDKLRAISTLAAGMAHEIKNPITVIKTFTEHLPKKSNDPAYIEKFTHIVSVELEKISETVKHLLEFSKPAQTNKEPLAVNRILDETLLFLDTQLLSKNITLHKAGSTQDLMVLGDKKQLGQVFLNIILNSIEAMPSGGVLTITCSGCAGVVIISIADTGIGIPKESLRRVFDPFFSSKESGTGLGLSVVYGIMKEHNADIGVESSTRNGATFTLRFKAMNM